MAHQKTLAACIDGMRIIRTKTLASKVSQWPGIEQCFQGNDLRLFVKNDIGEFTFLGMDDGYMEPTSTYFLYFFVYLCLPLQTFSSIWASTCIQELHSLEHQVLHCWFLLAQVSNILTYLKEIKNVKCKMQSLS